MIKTRVLSKTPRQKSQEPGLCLQSQKKKESITAKCKQRSRSMPSQFIKSSNKYSIQTIKIHRRQSTQTPQKEQMLSHRKLTSRSVRNKTKILAHQESMSEKKMYQNYFDQTYFYQKLHNKPLWEWDGFADHGKMKKDLNSRPCKLNMGVLERFRDCMEKRVGKRVPLIVKQMFQDKNIKI